MCKREKIQRQSWTPTSGPRIGCRSLQVTSLTFAYPWFNPICQIRQTPDDWKPISSKIKTPTLKQWPKLKAADLRSADLRWQYLHIWNIWTYNICLKKKVLDPQSKWFDMTITLGGFIHMVVIYNYDRWDNVYTKLTYFCNHQNCYISQPSYFKLCFITFQGYYYA